VGIDYINWGKVKTACLSFFDSLIRGIGSSILRTVSDRLGMEIYKKKLILSTKRPHGGPCLEQGSATPTPPILGTAMGRVCQPSLAMGYPFIYTGKRGCTLKILAPVNFWAKTPSTPEQSTFLFQALHLLFCLTVPYCFLAQSSSLRSFTSPQTFG